MLAVVFTAVTLAMAGCGSSHPRTEVLGATSPVISDVYLRITGPGGAVYDIAQRFMGSGSFKRFHFYETTDSQGLFVPPDVRERKLCASTHVIQAGDAPQLQQWRGRTLEITIYGKKTSRIFCAVLTGNLYLGGS